MNLDPSRGPASGIGDIFADGPGDRAVLPDSAGDDGWRSAAGEVWLAGDTPCCNSVVRDHSVSRGRKPHGIPGPGKTVAAELLRREPPSVIAAGDWTTAVTPWQVITSLFVVTSRRLPYRNPAARTAGSRLSRLRCPPYTVRAVDWMIGRMIRACGADDVAGSEPSSENYVFR